MILLEVWEKKKILLSEMDLNFFCHAHSHTNSACHFCYHYHGTVANDPSGKGDLN